MRIIDKYETMTWLAERGLTTSTGELVFTEFLSPSRFVIPVDSGEKTALSKTITSFFDFEDEALLWINEFGVWPSSEDRYLFEGFRQSLGEYSPLYEKPGHIFSNKDLEAVKALIAMVLYFCWGAVIVSISRSFIFKISHDEIIYLYVKNKEDLPSMRTTLSHFIEEKE